ncbi:MAG TPA: zf-HC2 domain-containing protein [Thermoleophilaceae bacterium]|nr:zf-HC2 domain-containing protein [Thermoleophilaceae bacterium]
MDDALHFRCQELVEQLTDYLDETLPPERMRLVRDHLALCDGCSAHLEQLRQAVALIAATPAGAPSAEHERRVDALFREWAAGR